MTGMLKQLDLIDQSLPTMVAQQPLLSSRWALTYSSHSSTLPPSI